MSITTRVTADRRRRHAVHVRTEQLPLAWRTATAAVERYLTLTGSADEEGLLSVLEDLLGRFEHANSAGFSITDIIGTDPIAFADGLKQAYGSGAWLAVEQRRLSDAIRQAEREQGPQ